MATKSGAMGTGWNIRRGKEADKDKVVGWKPPMAKYSRVSGGPGGTTLAVSSKGREISPEEEGRLISTHWGADKLAAPAAKKSASPAPVSSAGSPKAGPKPSASPAGNVRAKATTVAPSAPAGHSTTRMHTPTTAAAPSPTLTPPAASGRLIIPADTSGGDSGTGRTIAGIGAAVGAGILARKPIIGAGKLAGKAAKGVAWTLPKAVAGKISAAQRARTPLGKRIASLTSQPSGGAGTGRPAVGAAAQTAGPAKFTPSGKGVPIQTAPATTTATPAATAKPQAGAPIPAPKPAASGSAATPAAVQAKPNSRPSIVKAASSVTLPSPALGKPIALPGATAEVTLPVAKPEVSKPVVATSVTPTAPTAPSRAGEGLTGMDRIYAERRARGVPIGAKEVSSVSIPTPEPAPAKPPATSGPAQSLEGLGLKHEPTEWGKNAAAQERRVTTPSGQTVVRRKGKAKPAATPESAAANEAARMAKANVDETGVEKPMSPSKPAPKPSKAERIARAASVREQTIQRQVNELAEAVKRTKEEKGAPKSTISDVLPPSVRDKLLELKAATVPKAVQAVTPEGQADFQSEKEVRAQRVKERQIAKRQAMTEESRVGSGALRDPVKEAEIAARKAAVEAHMATKGYTKVATPSVEDAINKTRPEAAKVGPSAETPAPAPKAVKTKKAGKKGLQPSKALPRAGMGSRPQARSKGVPIKAGGLLGGAILAAGAAQTAHAAAPGTRAGAVGGFLKESGKSYAKDIAITAGLAAIPVAGPAMATGYAGVRVAEGIPDTIRNVVAGVKAASGFGSAIFNAYKERKASEAKYGSIEAATRTRKKKQGLI